MAVKAKKERATTYAVSQYSITVVGRAAFEGERERNKNVSCPERLSVHLRKMFFTSFRRQRTHIPLPSLSMKIIPPLLPPCLYSRLIHMAICSLLKDDLNPWRCYKSKL